MRWQRHHESPSPLSLPFSYLALSLWQTIVSIVLFGLYASVLLDPSMNATAETRMYGTCDASFWAFRLHCASALYECMLYVHIGKVGWLALLKAAAAAAAAVTKRGAPSHPPLTQPLLCYLLRCLLCGLPLPRLCRTR